MVPVPRTAAGMSALERAGVTSCILFARDMAGPEQTRALCSDLATRGRRRGAPSLLALDEEGGLVSQLKPWGLESPGPRPLMDAAPGLAGPSGRATGAAAGFTRLQS